MLDGFRGKCESRYEYSTRNDGGEVLKSVIKSQKRKIFWGLLRQTSVNLGKPYNSVYESGRRRFILIPALIHIKIASSSVEDYQIRTGRAFLRALNQGDVDTVTALLNPLLFTEEGRTPLSYDGWMKLRRRFAEQLIKADWQFEKKPEPNVAEDSTNLPLEQQSESITFVDIAPKPDEELEVVPKLTKGEDDNTLRFEYQGKYFSLRFTIFHDTLFVTTIEPEGTNP